MNKRLLVPAVIEKNLAHFSHSELLMYFEDYRFYNSLLTKKENMQVKLNARKRIVSGVEIKTMNFGDKINRYLYLAETRTNDKIQQFYPDRLIKSDSFTYKYTLTDSVRVDYYLNKLRVYTMLKPFDFRSIFAKLYRADTKFFTENITRAELDSAAQIIRLFIINKFVAYKKLEHLFSKIPAIKSYRQVGATELAVRVCL
jgi:hypothetical protein